MLQESHQVSQRLLVQDSLKQHRLALGLKNFISFAVIFSAMQGKAIPLSGSLHHTVKAVQVRAGAYLHAVPLR